MKTIQHSSVVIALLAVACADAAPTSGGTTSTTVAEATTATAPKPAPSVHNAMSDDDDVVPREAFKNGKASFDEVKDQLLKSYYQPGMSEDDLYRAATAGLLAQLDPKMKKYNKLLSPTEVAEMKNDLQGEMVGIGVQIEFEDKSGYTDVLGVIPGSPSEKVGLLAGDKIVTVDGKLYKGMSLRDVVYDIRGKAGTSVTLSILRGDKLTPFKIVRDKITYDTPSATQLGDVGYLRIPSFTERTPAAVKAGLEDLATKNVKALIIDLRHSPGGSFDRALDTAELLLPEGSPIVSLKKRDGTDESHVSKGKPILGDLPATVLIDEMTASGAELLAGALREQRHAKLVGTHTFGKWSVQKLEDLPNGWSYKYTLGLFKTPSGKNYEGTGIQPDVELAMDESALTKANAGKPEDRLTVDVQLRTAKELLAR